MILSPIKIIDIFMSHYTDILQISRNIYTHHYFKIRVVFRSATRSHMTAIFLSTAFIGALHSWLTMKQLYPVITVQLPMRLHVLSLVTQTSTMPFF